MKSIEDIVRTLLERGPINDERNSESEEDTQAEEILFDLEVDGARYLSLQNLCVTFPAQPDEIVVLRGDLTAGPCEKRRPNVGILPPRYSTRKIRPLAGPVSLSRSPIRCQGVPAQTCGRRC